MKKTTYYDLREKEVINCRTGMRLGFIEDLEIDAECGRILAIKVMGSCKGGFLFGKEMCCVVAWENIQKIGKDLIIVDCEQPCIDSEKPKRNFLFS